MRSVLSFLAGAVSFVLGQSGLLGIIPHGVAVALTGIGAVLGVLGIRSACAAPASFVALLDTLGRGWKTAVGVLVALVGVLLSPDVFGMLPAALAHVATFAGTILAALGVYHATSVSSTAPHA